MTTEQQELFVRADNFVTTMIPLADQTRPYAMWCGWALNEAWRVGYAAGRAAQAEQTSGKAADVPRTQPDDAESPGPLDPIADLCARLRYIGLFVDDRKDGISPMCREAADALERLARERDDIRKMLQNTNRDAARLANIAYKYKWQVRDTCIRAERAEAERDAMRECVRAADAMRTLQFDDLWEVREYDRARAKVRP